MDGRVGGTAIRTTFATKNLFAICYQHFFSIVKATLETVFYNYCTLETLLQAWENQIPR